MKIMFSPNNGGKEVCERYQSFSKKEIDVWEE